MMKHNLSRSVCSWLLCQSIFCVQLSAQPGSANVLPDGIKNAVSYELQEKIYVHTDKAFYVAGEFIWFKIYCVDGFFYKASGFSKVAYVELLDVKSIPVAQEEISLAENGNHGSFRIPLSISSGKFRIRAYTSLMRNQGIEKYFEKEIVIVNTLNKYNPPATAGKSFHIEFFPEGGDLVDQVQSRVAFKTTDAMGVGIACWGFVMADGKDTVARFESVRFGMGSFLFTPLKQRTYRAWVYQADGSVVSQDLPVIMNAGFVMRLSEEGDSMVRIRVNANNSNKGSIEKIFMAVTYRQQVKSVREMILVNGEAVLALNKNIFDEGISTFTIFNQDKEPVCERLFFKRPLHLPAVSVEVDQDVYALRKKVGLTINMLPASRNMSRPDMSVSVFKLDSLQRDGGGGITFYFYLGSELRGKIESPGYYLNPDNTDAGQMADLLLLTNGWRKFNKNVPEADKILFTPEYNGQLVTGMVTDSRNGQPGKNVTAYLSIPGINFRFYTAQSDSNGLVQFEVKDYYGKGELTINTQQADNFYRIRLLSPFDGNLSGEDSTIFSIPSSTKDLLQRSLGMQAMNIYHPEPMNELFYPAVKDSFHFFGRPTTTYLLDDYKRFTTMEEVLREYVREVNVSVRNGHLNLKMYNPLEMESFEQDILVLVDGVPLQDGNRIFSVDPLKIKKLDVVSRGYILGPAVFSAILSFSTYDGQFTGYKELDPSLSFVDFNGLQLQREFYSPRYETEEEINSRLPDFRNTLFWSADIHTDADGKAKAVFYTSDTKGKFLIRLEGLDGDGHPFVVNREIEVKE